MTYGAVGATAGGAAAQNAIAEALKASGAIVRVDEENFRRLLERDPAPLVVAAQGGWLSKSYQYLTPYRGLVFSMRSKIPLELPPGCEVVSARKIWIPA